MKRLTQKDESGWYLTGDGIYSDWGVPEKFRGEDIDSLAAIEDILGDEYELDRLKELVEADEEGRCGISPVKMHQKIFRVFDGEIYEEIVCGAIWEPLMPQQRWKVFVMGHGISYLVDEVLGKTVFLTRSEAEKALKAREQE